MGSALIASGIDEVIRKILYTQSVLDKELSYAGLRVCKDLFVAFATAQLFSLTQPASFGTLTLRLVNFIINISIAIYLEKITYDKPK